MVAAGGVAIAFVVAQLILAWQQKPFTVTKRLSARSIAFQLFAMSAQSKARGNVLINPGAISLYRADLVRKSFPPTLARRSSASRSRSATTRR